MSTLCPGCFKRDAPPSGGACPRCGYSEGQDRSPLALPLRTELKGRYQVGRVLGEPGGFGVTYLAFDERLEIRVAIKEYVPRELAGRGSDGVSVAPYSTGDQEEFKYGLERFLGEAKALAQFDHANIVSVRDFFEANGTAYLVMDYYEGKTLKQYLGEQPDGKMDPEAATEVMLRVLDGLRAVHAADYLHRDVKPDNIYLTAEGRPILIDFGAARLALGERSRSLSVVMTPGYAPYEQYRREGDQGPHTDVYGAGATLHRMVTGQKPPAATDRIVDDTLEPPHRVNPTVPEALGEAVVEALAPGNKERLGTAEAMQERLQAGLRTEEEETSSTEQSPVEWQEARDKASRQRGSPQGASTSEQSPERTGASEPVEASEPTGGPGGEGRAGLTSSTGTEEGRVRGERQEAKDESKGIGISPYAVVGVVAVLLGGVGAALYSGGGTGSGSQAQAEQTASQIEPENSGNEGPSAEERETRRIDRLLKEARTDLRADRLTTPEGESAYDAVQEVLEIDPGNAEAQSLRGEIASRYADLAEDAEASGDVQQAATYFSRSLEVENQPEVRNDLEAVRRRMQKQEEYERLLSEVRSTLNRESPSAEDLQEATAAARDVKELQPGSEEAEKLLGQIASRAAELGKQAETSLQYQQAVRYYEQSLELRDDASIQEKLESARQIRAGRVPARTLRGHKGSVYSVAFSPNGSLVATGSGDDTARLWSLETGKEIRVLRGHENSVSSVAFSPDGSQVATGSDDGTAQLWSARTGEQLHVLRGHENVVESVTFSPDGSRVATGSTDGTMRLWSAQTGKKVRGLRADVGLVYSVAFSPDGSRVATGGTDNTARLWSAQTGEQAQVLSGHRDMVWSVAFSPDGSWMATGTGDGTARLWSARTGYEVQVLRRHENAVRSVAFSPDGSLLATGSFDDTARLWSAQTGEEVQILDEHERNVYSVAFSPDGSLVVTGSGDKTAKLWYVSQGL